MDELVQARDRSRDASPQRSSGKTRTRNKGTLASIASAPCRKAGARGELVRYFGNDTGVGEREGGESRKATPSVPKDRHKPRLSSYCLPPHPVRSQAKPPPLKGETT